MINIDLLPNRNEYWRKKYEDNCIFYNCNHYGMNNGRILNRKITRTKRIKEKVTK